MRAIPKVKPLAAVVLAEPKASLPAIDPRAWAMMLPEIEEISKRYAINQARTQQNNPFQFPKFPTRAEPPKELGGTMAMDSALSGNLTFASNEWLAGDVLGGLSGEGLLFLGYTYLSELAQRPEYRVMSETIADDATREWIDFDVVGDEKQQKEDQAKDPEGYAERMHDPDERKKRVQSAGKTDRVKELADDQLRLEVKDRFYEQCRNDGFFGRSHLFLDIRTNDSTDEMNPAELKTDIGDGRNETSKSKVPQGSFKAIRTIEPVWTYPLMYNAINPLRKDWYNPQVWFVSGQEIHGSRLQTFIGHPVPDMLKPAYAFGGLSLSQMSKPYVDRWLTTVTSVNRLIHSFSVMVLMTDLSTLMQPGNVGGLLARVAMFNMLRDNQGTFVVNKNTEDFKNVSASLAGLHELQAQAQEHMASINRIPLVKFTGIQPAGLNASSEGEIKVYDDTIAAYQARFADPNLRRVINFEMLSLWGEVDPEITHRWEPLRQITQAEKGQKEKDDADRNQKYVDMGAIAPEEVRKAIINDKDLPYTGLDPDDLPEPPVDEGMVGPGIKPPAEGEAPGGAQPPKKPEGGGANDAALPFGATDAAEFKEGDHPRAPDGKFGTGSGSSLKPSDLKKTGERLGSNEGGTFADKSGNRFYVKRPASKAHVANELAASRLYKLAGVNTLKYRDVEGGNHVATELEKLDKKNVADLTPAERKEAAKDFAVHAWLSNWDAAGTGGDNQGVLNGKVTTLDVGGALRYRAQGGPKGAAFGPKVGEFDTMRDPKMSQDAAKLFGKMTDAEIADSVARVAAIPDDDIRKAAGDDALADTLIARKADMVSRFGATSGKKDGTGTIKDKSGNEYSVEYSSENDRQSYVVKNKDGDEVARALMPQSGSMAEQTFGPYVGNVDVDEKHQRKGIASALYDHIENHHGKPLNPSPGLKTEAGKKLWEHRGPKGAHDEAPFDESKHPRSPDGKFGSGSGSSGPKFEQHLLTKPAIAGANYRKSLVKAIAVATPEEKATLTGKLIDSWGKTYLNTMKKGDTGTAFKIAKKISKLGGAIPSYSPNAAALAEAKGKETDAQAQQILQNAGLAKAKNPTPTNAEAEKAKKTAPLKIEYVPGAPQTASAQKLIDGFNEKWAGKPPSGPEAIAQKVADFKDMQAAMIPLMNEQQQEAAAKQQAIVEQAKIAAAAKAAAAIKKAAKAAEKNKRIMADLGISDNQADAVAELATMLGSKSGDIVSSFQKYAKEAEAYGYPITGFQCALIHNYSGSGFVEVNKKLRSGSWTPAQHMYVAMVNKALLTMPKHTGVVIRNTTLTSDQLAIYKEGHVVQEQAFLSTSTGNVFSGNVRMKVTAIGKRGASIKKLSNHPGENEVLFAARTFFKVSKVEKSPGGQTVINMEEWEEH